MRSIGLLFGSFNPLHNGHLAMAHRALAEAGLAEVWFVLQPSNAYIAKDAFLNEATRRELLEAALADESAFKVYMPNAGDNAHLVRDVVAELADHYQLTVILGEDLAESFDAWPDAASIRARAELFTCPRLGAVSSGLVRQRLQAGESIRDLVPPVVQDYLMGRTE